MEFHITAVGRYEHKSEIFRDIKVCNLPYLFGYKTDFSFQNNPSNLDLSYKMDLGLKDCLGRANTYYSQVS